MTFSTEIESQNPASAGLCIEVTYFYDRASKTSGLTEVSISRREPEENVAPNVSLSIHVIPEGDELWRRMI